MTFMTTRCTHCQSMNRLPIGKVNEDPICGRCKKTLLEGTPMKELVITSIL